MVKDIKRKEFLWWKDNHSLGLITSALSDTNTLSGILLLINKQTH